MEKTIGDAGEVTTSSGTGVGVADDMSAYVEVFPQFIGSSAVVISGERDTSVKGLVISISGSGDISIEAVLFRI